jgi:hypothetical protein
VLGRVKPDLHVIADDPLEGEMTWLDSETFAELLFDDNLTFRSDLRRHCMTPPSYSYWIDIIIPLPIGSRSIKADRREAVQVEGVEQQPEGAHGLRTVLRPQPDQHHPSLADLQVDHGRPPLQRLPTLDVAADHQVAHVVGIPRHPRLVQAHARPARHFWFESGKGRRIHNLLILPPGFDESRTYPLVQLIHGGPHGSSDDSFSYRCLFSHAGLISLEGQWATSDGIYHREVSNGGPPWGDSPIWRDQSPFTYAERFKTPVLVSVGVRDFRVPLNQSLGYWSALQRRQVPSRLLVFPRANHWISNAEDGRYYHQELRAWLERYLGED